MAVPPERIVSFFGIFAFAGIAWILSTDRRRVNWHLVLGGIAFQIVIAILLFQVPAGTKAFLFLNDIVIKIMDCASAGSKFVFGDLANPSSGFILAFQAFPTIIFFSSLVSILYYYNIMGRIVQVFAFLFTRLFRISGAEALTAASNIFMGVEASLTVKPYLPQMTRSELCVVLSVGMATVSANILGLYVFTLKPYFPQIAGHLMTASLLAAPAAIITAKLMVPEDGTPVTLGRSVPAYQEKDGSLFEAIINGATAGVKMVVGITALLIAVLGLVALVELMLGGFSLKTIFGHIFYPLTWLTGIDHRDVGIVSQLIGERLVMTEVTAYRDLAEQLAKGAIADWRSTVIAVYALCGFAHVASMAIFVGGTAALAPSQTGALSKVALRALVAANLACLMTAAVAGTFITQATVQ